MPMRPYHRFVVRGVVALCEQGQPIPPDSLTEIAAVCHETTDNDNDPNISAFGVYGVLFDQSVDSIADCPTKVLADAVAEALNKQYGKKTA